MRNLEALEARGSWMRMGVDVSRPRELARCCVRLAFCGIISLLLLSPAATSARAQGANSDAVSDGMDALSDALLAVPHSKTPVPNVNFFATTPGLEEPIRVGNATFNLLAPFRYNSNVEGVGSGGTSSGEGSPAISAAGSYPFFNSRLRLSGLVGLESDRFTNASQADFDKIRINVTARYINPDNDQGISPFISYIPRIDFSPTYAREFATRQDLNIGFSKLFNFDGTFRQIPRSGSSAADAVWSAGLTVFVQRRFRTPPPQSYALVVAPSIGYAISPSWSASFDTFFTLRAFDSPASSPRSFLLEPIATVEYSLPDSLFGGNASRFGSPAIDLQAAYERNWTRAPGLTANIWYVGFALKSGWNLF